MSNYHFTPLRDPNKKPKRNARTYEDTLTPEQKRDLTVKMLAFWESVCSAYPKPYHLRALRHYRRQNND